jgi:hypothetical protein
MPIIAPTLDDRRFPDLVEDVLRRIPAHTPEWTNPRLGDPGYTLVELFAWLTDTLLYRANLIPERQRLAFLRLAGVNMRPAVSARGLVSIAFGDDTILPLQIEPLATLKGTVPFETRDELTVLPLTAQAYIKRALAPEEERSKAGLLRDLTAVYGIRGRARAYATTPVFPAGAADSSGVDVVARTIDGMLWLALLAPNRNLVSDVRANLGAPRAGTQRLLNLGLVPSLEVPGALAEIGPRARIPHVWEVSAVRTLNGREVVEYITLDVLSDTTQGLTQRGIVRVSLPEPEFLGAPANDPRQVLDAGVGIRPPRIDQPDIAARLVTWLRLRPTIRLNALTLSWVGINAVEIDQRQTARGIVIGQSDGAADQTYALPARSIEPESLVIEVDAAGTGYTPWQRVEDVATAGRDDAVYALDSEAGTIRFGDGVRGMIPPESRRVRVTVMRAGGGRAGNVPPLTLKEVSATELGGAPVRAKLVVQQSVATIGGDDAETLPDAERRIAALFQHRDRAVTEQDYRRIATETQGVRLGRVEVLPRFKPQQRRSGVPGVVTVLVLPHKEGTSAPAPRPDRPVLEAVFAHLDTRRPLTTELYVVGAEYVPVAVSVGFEPRDDVGEDQVLLDVRNAIRAFLWPLLPGGVNGIGWPLGTAVTDREIAVAVARVPGVLGVGDVRLFTRERLAPPTAGASAYGRWQPVSVDAGGVAIVRLRPWQLPELLAVAVSADGIAPREVTGMDAEEDGRSTDERAQDEVSVPVIPKVC